MICILIMMDARTAARIAAAADMATDETHPKIVDVATDLACRRVL